MKAMIFAAGLGSRLRPLTDAIPKALVEVNGIPMLQRVIQRLVSYGFSEIVINVHYLADQIIDFLAQNDFGATITISDERKLLLDTGGGLWNAAHFFDDGQPFLLHNVDVLSDIDLNAMYQGHIQNNALATLLVQDRVSSRELLFDTNLTLKGWRNNKTGEQILTSTTSALLPKGFCGIHVIDPVVFNYVPADKVFSIIPIYLEFAQKQMIKAWQPSQFNWIDIGTHQHLEQAHHLFG